jgi:predicted unusual protein kinase regulating ubiquinone biosynthesis (AarF/ABC1/UbiB family)
VHRAALLDGTKVAVKVQYPSVADSIESDLNNLRALVGLTLRNALPPGLFIDQIIKVAGTELAWECDYALEARSQSRYRALVQNDKVLSKHISGMFLQQSKQLIAPPLHLTKHALIHACRL